MEGAMWQANGANIDKSYISKLTMVKWLRRRRKWLTAINIHTSVGLNHT
jgi:hypothetical protein